MELHNRNNNSKQTIGRIKNKIKHKRMFYFSFFLLLMFSVSIASFFYGVHIYYTGRYYPIRMLAHRIVRGDFSFIKNKMNSSISYELAHFDIDLKFIKEEKLRYLREVALSQGYLSNDLQEKISAKLKFNNETYKVDISLTGQTIEHCRHPEKWSLSVKVKDGKTILGMRKFALLVPLARGYLTDWMAHKILMERDVLGIRKDFIDVSVNGRNQGVYYLEERFDKLLIESNHFKEGIIFKNIDNSLHIYNEKNLKKNPEFEKQIIHLNKLWYSFLNKEIKANQLFDLEKFASTAVVSDLMDQKHPLYFSNMRFYFNPITNLVEPIAREWGILAKESKRPFSALFIEDPNSPGASAYHKGLEDDMVIQNIYNSLEFYELYVKEAEIISSKQFLDSILIKNKLELNTLLNKLYTENPFYEFPREILYDHQKIIREKLHPQMPILRTEFVSFENNKISFLAENNSGLPIEIHYLNYDNEIKIFPKERLIIDSKYKKDLTDQIVSILLGGEIDLNEFNSEFIEVRYSILGVDELRKTIFFTKSENKHEISKINPTRKPDNLNEFIFLKVNDNLKTIEFSNKKCEISKDLIIPKGYVVTAKSGCVINLINSAKIISYSPFLFFGEKEKEILINSPDSTGQGLVIYNSDKISEFTNVNFENLSNLEESGWKLSGAVSFYESPVNFINCRFLSNIKGDDFLNIIRSDFNIYNCHFSYIKSDAIDGDFCTGSIRNSKFANVGNDAIDISGSNLKIDNIEMINIGDKGLSAGENSKIFANNVKITNTEISVCAKDMSIIEISNVVLENNQIGFNAFQKKPEFGKGTIKGNKVHISKVVIPYLIEANSLCIIDGVVKKSNIEKVKDILYGVKYGKSSK